MCCIMCREMCRVMFRMMCRVMCCVMCRVMCSVMCRRVMCHVMCRIWTLLERIDKLDHRKNWNIMTPKHQHNHEKHPHKQGCLLRN